ncbi:MAG TPA: glycoside hydrolase family 15 protein [Gaiellaceae bacterium]
MSAVKVEPHSLRDYAVLADGERAALIGPKGDFVWMCFPRWDSDAVFPALIGGEGGYAITPVERFVWGGYYEPGGLIWRSRWVTVANAVIECREALALPADRSCAVVLRRVIARRDQARVEVVLNPRGAFGADPLRGLRRDDAGRWHGRVGDAYLCWAGGGDAKPESDGSRGKALRLRLDLGKDEHHDFVLTLATDAAGAEPPDADVAWSATEQAWRERVPELEYTVGSRDARHAYAVLSGLTSSAGGMVAAATMSLPERAREGRNFDYRYAWIRDQCYAGRAAATAGPHAILDGAVGFVGAALREHGARLRPVYTVAGEPVPDERELDLPGYPGADKVLVGNRAKDQFQLDAFGEALLLFAAAAGHDRLETGAWRAAEIAADAIAERWREPDAGIWEIEPDEWTHGRLICAAGLRAISGCAPGGEKAAAWLALADAIVADTAAHCVHPSGRWQRSARDPRPDASLLLPAIRGAVPPDDPRSLATLRAVTDELTEDGYAYRYRPDDRPLGEAEGAFLLCGFLLSLAFGRIGDEVAAARWFERTRAGCGPPGLLAEEFDVGQRQLRGNLPQAFVHALLLECAASSVSSSPPSGSGSGRGMSISSGG